VVVSFVPGRVRLRFKELKNGAAAERAKARIEEVPGITKVEVNPLTGGILIEYDPAVLPPEKLAEAGGRELAKLSIKLEIPGLPL
jgi:copper chaperone CopZ